MGPKREECNHREQSVFGSAQETVKAYPFIGFGLERFYPGALGCQRWSPGPQCFRADGPCLMAAFRILQHRGIDRFPHSATMGFLRPWLVLSFPARESGEESQFLLRVQAMSLAGVPT